MSDTTNEIRGLDDLSKTNDVSGIVRLIPRDTRTELWIAAGMKRPYRVTSDRMTYDEFDQLDDARTFLALLLLGNPERFRGTGA